MADKKSSVLLEVDDSTLKNKLILPENMPEDFESLLPLLEGMKEKGEVPWKLVQPSPGKCVKTHLPDGEKVFINICHTPDIPSPHNVDEETLLKMYASADDDSPDVGIRIPLSIGECHEELDKSGDPCKAYDVAVSSEFLERADSSRVYLRFLIQVVIESVADKFKLELNVDQYSVLKNRKVMGKLQRHRIEQRAPKGPLIQELGPSSSIAAGPSSASATPSSSSSSLTTTTTPTPSQSKRQPELCRMARRAAPQGGGRALLVAELGMADVASAGEVSFRAGEDRLVVESARRGYSWDVFVPLQLDADAARATFVRKHRVLNIQVPIVAG